MKKNAYFLSYLAQFFLDCEMFQTKAVEKMKTRILGAVTSSKMVILMRQCGAIM